jgi:hypothetical protein
VLVSGEQKHYFHLWGLQKPLVAFATRDFFRPYSFFYSHSTMHCTVILHYCHIIGIGTYFIDTLGTFGVIFVCTLRELLGHARWGSRTLGYAHAGLRVSWGTRTRGYEHAGVRVSWGTRTLGHLVYAHAGGTRMLGYQHARIRARWGMRTRALFELF